MSLTKEWSTVSKSLLDAAPTNEVAIGLKTGGNVDERASREHWQVIIDRKLIEWGRDLESLADEGVEPPTKETIQKAIHLAEAFRDEGFPPPDSVVADPNGGIVFERRERNVAEVCHLWDDGTVEYQRFQDTQLVDRRTF
ncbi:MAG: hypothetical protein K8T89_00070 [Planctomycetes bacterium]|nr:hypothetical protein [Planctomycetota bacterium]